MSAELADHAQHVRSADIGMTGERYLPLWRENPHFGVVPRGLGWQHEGRLGVVELTGDRLHLLCRQPLCLGKHSELVASKACVRKHVDRVVSISHCVNLS